MRNPINTDYRLRRNSGGLSRRSQERGAIALEFAISFPIVISVFMVMMFLMDVMMVKQEVTNVGHTAMRECTQIPNPQPGLLAQCVLDLVDKTQTLAGSNHRYSCIAGPSSFSTTGGTTVSVVNLRCTYGGFAPIAGIFDLVGEDMSQLTTINVPVFFPN